MQTKNAAVLHPGRDLQVGPQARCGFAPLLPLYGAWTRRLPRACFWRKRISLDRTRQKGDWHRGHVFLVEVLNHLKMHSLWNRCLQVAHLDRGSVRLVRCTSE